MEAAGQLAKAKNPLAWFAMETDSNGERAGLTLRLWPGDIRLSLGSACFHCRWVEWTGSA
jgi:hypothetical protein